MTTLCFKTKHSIFFLLLYFTSPTSHSKCYIPRQECPCYFLVRIRNARRKRQGSNHHKQNRRVVPSGTLGALCSISIHSPHWGGGQGIKCSTSVIEVMQNIQKKACKNLYNFQSWVFMGTSKPLIHYKWQEDWGIKAGKASTLRMAHLGQILLI